jgi:pimeloyl-ACP methyl ester carboxylesterase
MTMVLVHGGGYDRRCWDRMMPLVGKDAVAVDLPGRGNRPADLAQVGIADFVDAVAGDIEAHDLHDVALVGHSMAGLTLPQVAARLPERIRALVFVSCTVPEDGQTIYDTLEHEIQAMYDRGGGAFSGTLPVEIAKAVFYNDIDDAELLAWALTLLVPEAPATIKDAMVLATLPVDIRRVWVRLTRDQIITPDKQDRFIANLGGAEVVELDAGHMAMISRPAELASILQAV